MSNNANLDHLLQKSNQTPDQNQAIRLNLTLMDTNLILRALQELPHRVVDPLINDIIGQTQSQIQKK